MSEEVEDLKRRMSILKPDRMHVVLPAEWVRRALLALEESERLREDLEEDLEVLKSALNRCTCRSH